MDPDEFFGTTIATRNIGKYRLALRQYEEHDRLPRHTHGEAFVTIIMEGGFREESAGSILECGPHDVVVHAPEDRHVNYFTGRRTRCLSVQGGAFDRNSLLASPVSASIALKFVREFRAPDVLSAMVVEAMMLELFVAAERQRDERRPPCWLTNVRATIDRHFQEPLTLTDLAQSVDVHPGHLARVFRHHYGTTVGETMRGLRVAYALQRLESSAPLYDIALDAGFADQSHFTRTFRRATGMTPARYRRTLSAF
jgi:AraC family transcriptional regulator